MDKKDALHIDLITYGCAYKKITFDDNGGMKEERVDPANLGERKAGGLPDILRSTISVPVSLEGALNGMKINGFRVITSLWCPSDSAYLIDNNKKVTRFELS